MFARALVLVVGLTAIAAGLLVLRHERIQAHHEMTRSHARMERTAHDLWVTRARQAQELEPTRLKQRLDEAGLELQRAVEPVQPPTNEP